MHARTKAQRHARSKSVWLRTTAERVNEKRKARRAFLAHHPSLTNRGRNSSWDARGKGTVMPRQHSLVSWRPFLKNAQPQLARLWHQLKTTYSFPDLVLFFSFVTSPAPARHVVPLPPSPSPRAGEPTRRQPCSSVSILAVLETVSSIYGAVHYRDHCWVSGASSWRSAFCSPGSPHDYRHIELTEAGKRPGLAAKRRTAPCRSY